MAYLALALALFVALQHVGFLVLEMFLLKQPTGRKIFGLTKEFAEQSAGLAMNQGLYNGFLAAGIVVGVLLKDPLLVRFSLGCVVVAGVFGGATVKRSILFIQALPASIALALALLA